MSDIKLCKDCKHYNLSDEWDSPYFKKKYATCSLYDYVNGDSGDRKCRDERKSSWFGCGPKARYWEAK